MEGVELYPRPGRMIVASPTHDGRVVTIAFWPQNEFPAVRADIEAAFHDAVALAPGLAERLRTGRRAERFRGTRLLPNHFRTASGHGLGPRRRRRVPQGPDPGPRHRRRLPRRRAARRGDRGRRLWTATAAAATSWPAPGFESSVQFAALQPPSEEMQELFARLRGDQDLTDRFFGTFAGTVAPGELFSAAGR